MELFPDQNQFVDDIRQAFRSHKRVLAVASTGFGKTVCFSHIAARASAAGKRVTIAAHRDRIVEQIGAALSNFGIRHGFIMPKHRPTNDLVQVAMIQTLANRIASLPKPDLFVIDEAHHSVAGAYQACLKAFEDAFALGVTATPQRLDGRGLGTIFTALVEAPPMADLISMGRLSEYIYYAPDSGLDLSRLKTRGGDYAIDELAEAVKKSTIVGDSVAHYRMHLNGLPAIAFCVNVAEADSAAEKFRSAGYQSASVHGKMDRGEIRARFRAVERGEMNVLTSCALISEGVDIPAVAGIIDLKPTKSLADWLQRVGRGLRVKKDGSRAFIFDHVGNRDRFGLPDSPRVWSLDTKQKKQPSPSLLTCIKCYRAFYAVTAKTHASGCEVENCPILTKSDKDKGGIRPPDQVDGQLIEVKVSPSWTGGINILTAKGDQWKALVRAAQTREHFIEIAKLRGYKPRWVECMMEFRRQHPEREDPPPAVPEDFAGITVKRRESAPLDIDILTGAFG